MTGLVHAVSCRHQHRRSCRRTLIVDETLQLARGAPLVGAPDKVADELAAISQAGVRGIGLSFVNDLDEVPCFCDEMLPRPERQRAREASIRGFAAALCGR